MNITLASGLILDVRRWNLGDIDETIAHMRAEAKASKRRSRRGLPLTAHMLRCATLSVVDPGPYDFEVGKLPDWSALTFPDLLSGNILVRRLTRRYLRLVVPCPRCGHLGDDAEGDGTREVDSDHIPIYDASDEGVEAIRVGVPIERQFTSEDDPTVSVSVKLDVLRVKDVNELAAQLEANENKQLAVQTALQIRELTVNGGRPLSAFVDIFRAYLVLPWDLRDEIEDAVDEAYGGIDPTVHYECSSPSCGAKWEGVLDMDPTFYGLGERKTRKKRQGR